MSAPKKGGWPAGRPHTEETRAKMSATLSTPEHRERAAALMQGKKLSEETKAKMSERKKGRPRSAETRAKISATLQARSAARRAAE